MGALEGRIISCAMDYRLWNAFDNGLPWHGVGLHLWRGSYEVTRGFSCDELHPGDPCLSAGLPAVEVAPRDEARDGRYLDAPDTGTAVALMM